MKWLRDKRGGYQEDEEAKRCNVVKLFLHEEQYPCEKGNFSAHDFKNENKICQ